MIYLDCVKSLFNRDLQRVNNPVLPFLAIYLEVPRRYAGELPYGGMKGVFPFLGEVGWGYS